MTQLIQKEIHHHFLKFCVICSKVYNIIETMIAFVGITILTIPKGIVSVGLIPGIILIILCSYAT